MPWGSKMDRLHFAVTALDISSTDLNFCDEIVIPSTLWADTLKSGQMRTGKVSKKCPSKMSDIDVLSRKPLRMREPTMGLEPMTC